MTTELSIANETQVFELVQRQAKLLSSSTLVPKEFQGNMANCAIGLNIAKRLGADPFMVLQNIDVIHGRPSFRATFLIAMVNASGRFSPLQFEMKGEGKTRSCVATATTSNGERVEGPEITMAMADAEGWSTKPGSKWKTMPELMLRYRAAAFFARIYAPDITLGMQTSEESYDVPEERQAVGRVITPAIIASNPYGDEEEPEPVKEYVKEKAKATAAKETPAPAEEPPPFEPADDSKFVNEADERASLIADVKATCVDQEVTFQTFGGRCKNAGIVTDGATLRDISIEALRIVHDNRLAIILGTYEKEEA